MSSSFANFAEKNPFEDPAVLEALRIEQSTNAGPGSSTSNQNANQAVEQAITQAILGPPPPYSSPTSYDPNAAQELRRKQEELERKAAELQRREDEMQRNVEQQVRRNNFPPLPSFCPLKPCFYQDISIDIPLQFQNLVKMGFRLWLAYVVLLLANMFISMIYLISSASNDVDNSSGSTFGLSIVLLIIFTPCSFVCWFRPLYNAFRIDSSFNFFFFFFIFFFQFVVSIMQALGLSGWGTVGIVSSVGMLSHGSGGSLFAGLLMLSIGLMFAALAVLDLMLLIKVHRIFRSTGASFAKAQQEFSQDIMGNRTFHQAASNLISSNAGASNTSSSRY